MNNLEGYPPVNEMVNYLNRSAPETLEELRKKYPQYREKLRPGIIGGDKIVKAEEKEVDVAICLKTMQCVVDEVPNNLKWIKKRLEKTQKIELASQIVVTVSSASLMATLSLSNPSIVTFITGTMTLAGSLTALFSKYLREHPLTGGNLVKDYQQMSECEIEAKLIATELKARLEYKAFNNGTSKLIKRGNVLCHNLIKITAKYPNKDEMRIN